MPSDKRARQRAAREMRLAAEAKAKKRRKQIRNVIVVAVIAGIVIGIVFLTSSSSPPKKSATTTTTTTTTAPTTTTTSVAGSSTTVPPAIGAIPAADLSPAGTAGKAPTVVVPPGSPPTQLESADLITGTGPAAKTGDSLTVQYVLATYSSRKTVQSSWTSQPFTFTLGQGVIQGWDEGVVGMKVGGRRELIVPPSLGYGSTAQGAGIAANDTLVFIIDLVKIG
ncbi:MAG: FKBP-type peptidyl-prolyl cis-trans isomerase [Acidimicrobiales bacterium]